MSMQTFLPYADFDRSARVLDYRRLGKQRVEAETIRRTILYGSGWRNHPAVKMWAGFEAALVEYRDAVIREWVRRGYQNSMPYGVDGGGNDEIITPWWLGDERLHASHRSNLLRKDPHFYSQYGWKEPDDLPYFWPV